MNAAVTHSLGSDARQLGHLHRRLARHLAAQTPRRNCVAAALTDQARVIESLHEALSLVAGHDPDWQVDAAANDLHEAACAHHAVHDRAVALLAATPRRRWHPRKYARALRMLRLCAMEMGEHAVHVRARCVELVELVDALR